MAAVVAAVAANAAHGHARRAIGDTQRLQSPRIFNRGTKSYFPPPVDEQRRYTSTGQAYTSTAIYPDKTSLYLIIAIFAVSRLDVLKEELVIRQTSARTPRNSRQEINPYMLELSEGEGWTERSRRVHAASCERSFRKYAHYYC